MVTAVHANTAFAARSYHKNTYILKQFTLTRRLSRIRAIAEDYESYFRQGICYYAMLLVPIVAGNQAPRVPRDHQVLVGRDHAHRAGAARAADDRGMAGVVSLIQFNS